MSFSAGTLLFFAASYLALLFLIALAAEKDWLPRKLTHSPAIYVLSLGVYATTWSYYGSVGLASSEGLTFITIYLGVMLAFILTPVLLMPMLRLTRTYQLSSIADVFAFRYNSQLAGVLVTLMILAGSLPYLALQIRAVADTTRFLSGDAAPGQFALGFCLLVTVFAIIFGARHVSPREKHTGLVFAIAFESTIKLAALLVLAGVATYMAFGGLGGLNEYLQANPATLDTFYRPTLEGPWISLTFLAFCASFLLPRQFHMAFTENQRPSDLLTAAWGFPFYLLLLSLAIPPILWAGQALGSQVAPDYFVLDLAMLSGSPGLTLFIYLGGISAASAMLIVSTLALSSMTLNNLLLPQLELEPPRNLYKGLRWARRVLIAILIAAGYGFYRLLEHSQSLVSWGLISFLAMAQLLPGVIGTLFWPRATSKGLIAGLLGGGSLWGVTALLPAITGHQFLELPMLASTSQASYYGSVAFWSVSLNGFLFVAVTLATKANKREREAAAACVEISTLTPSGKLQAENPAQFVTLLAPVTGPDAAHAEVEKAIQDLELDWQEQRPERLHQLSEQIERNLSGIMGPILARMIVDNQLMGDSDTREALTQNIRLIEERLEHSRTHLKGVAAELDRLRRYHRQILDDLPLGIIALTQGQRILRWNPAAEQLTGVPAQEALGKRLTEIAAPWGAFLKTFVEEGTHHAYKLPLTHRGQKRWYALRRAMIDVGASASSEDMLLLLEDQTDLQTLEQELAHSERLASIGQLAAGVAHEIGNPVTGISCLAQELRDDPERREENASHILEQAKRITSIVQTLVSYAHAGSESVRANVRVSEAVAEAFRIVGLSKRSKGVNLLNQVPADIYVQAEHQRLVQVFVNLLTNATDASEEGDDIVVAARHLADGGIEITVTDTGCGIADPIRDRILEPFFTTKPAGKGTGLGLSLAHNILKEYGGELRYTPNPGGGSIFTITLGDTA